MLRRTTIQTCPALVFALLMSIATAAVAQIDFTGMSDVEVRMHPDKTAAFYEYTRRSVDYTREQHKAVHREWSRLVENPQEQKVWTTEELFEIVNTSLDWQCRFKTLLKIGERFEEGDTAAREEIKAAFLRAWSEVPFVVFGNALSEKDKADEQRNSQYARSAARFINTEAELLPLLKEKYLSGDLHEGKSPFFSALDFATVELGQTTADEVEKIYNVLKAEGRGGVFRPGVEAYDNSRIHRLLGRCGKAGFDAIARMGTLDTEPALLALSINRDPEAEAVLWERYEAEPENHDRARIELLGALARKRGDPEIREARKDRIRQELIAYLQLPEGEVNLWDLGYAVSLAKETGDPFFLSHVEALEGALRQLGPEEKITGGDANADRTTRLRTFFEDIAEAKEKLEERAVVTRPTS